MLSEAGDAALRYVGLGRAAGPLPPLLHPTTSLEQAVADDTLGVGFAAAG
jgi:hypothetical protein